MKKWNNLTLISKNLHANFVSGQLRSVCINESEVIQAVYVAVRDKNWNTVPGIVKFCENKINSDSFEICYEVLYVDNKAGINYLIKGNIVGTDNDVIQWHIEGRAQCNMQKNRIGFCVLHPLEMAGQNIKICHKNNTITQSVFPNAISAEQPFLNIKSVEYSGVQVLFKGDVFEMEDQRNWTDASFKTYCTPLKYSFPVTVRKGDVMSQSITIKMLPHKTNYKSPPKMQNKHTLASLGTSLTSLCDGKSVNKVKSLPFTHFRLEIKPNSNKEKILQILQIIKKAERELLLVFFLDESTENDVYINFIKDVSLKNVRVSLVGCPPLKIVPAQRISSFLRALKKVLVPKSIVIGTDAFFAELNRNIITSKISDGYTYSINPQVHAVDNTSIVETLSGQVDTINSAKALANKHTSNALVYVSPLSFKMRWNPNATSQDFSVNDTDKRQESDFFACWVLASLLNMSCAGVNLITICELVGKRGLLDTSLQKHPVCDALSLLKDFENAQVIKQHIFLQKGLYVFLLKKANKAMRLIINLSNYAEVLKDFFPQLNNTFVLSWDSQAKYKKVSKKINKSKNSVITLNKYSVLGESF